MSADLSTPASGAPPTPSPRSVRIVLLIAMAGVLAVAVVLRFVTRSDLWLDEALTVNIARLPLSELRAALLRDGAPPLYYVLLHGWMRVFGSGDVAVRAFSGVLGLVMIWLTYFAGARLAGGDAERRRWGAWSAVVVVALSPYAIRFSTEARMYMLAMVIVLVGYLTVTAIVDDGANARRVGALALSAGALLYTQYWAVFLLAVVGAVMLVRAWRAPAAERPAARAVLLGLGIGGVLFLPWVPTFLSQLAHTGTPWDTPVTPPTAAALGILDFVGGRTVEGWSLVLVVVVLALLALVARPTGPRTLTVDLRTVPGVRWEWLVGGATLALGLTASFATGTGFQARYAAVMFPLFALAVAMGVLVFTDVRIRIGILAFIVAFGAFAGARNVVTNRTQASQVVDVIAAEAKPGDVVVDCPDQLGPDTSRLMPRGLGVRQVVYPTFGSPKFVDWVDYADRNAAADPQAFARRVVHAGRGHAIWVIWSPGYRTLDGQCEAMLNAIGGARRGAVQRVTADDAIYEFMGLTQYPAG